MRMKTRITKRIKTINTCKRSGEPRSSAPLRYAAVLLAMLMAVSVFLLPAAAASDDMARVADNGDLISSSAEDEINAIAARIYQKYNFNLYIATAVSLGGSSSEAMADDLYNSLFPLNSDGMLLLVCMNEREYAISTSGSAVWELEEDRRLDNITDAVVERLSFGDYDLAGIWFAKLTESCLDAIRPGEGGTAAVGNDNWQESYNDIIDDYWVHYQRPENYDNISIGGISQAFGELSSDTHGYASAYLTRCLKRLLVVLLISIIIAFVWVGIMRSGMNNIKKSNRAANYVRRDSFKLTKSQDRYLYSTVTKTPRAQTSSGTNGNRGGGGGGISHHSSSGGSHGGRSGKF